MRISWDGNNFIVHPGFEQHPVTKVSWYGAGAYCNYLSAADEFQIMYPDIASNDRAIDTSQHESQ